MHRSRIGLVLIDHPASDWDAGLAFWSGVQGVTPTGESEEFRAIGTIAGVALESQRTGDGTPARVHLDIETDDVPAEIARVIGMGATVHQQHDGWAVLQDPGGLLFCVVPVQTGDLFEQHALTWD
jgi:predicted enzyme related to lactoylglutathione lyase